MIGLDSNVLVRLAVRDDSAAFTFDGEFARSALVFLEKSDDVAQSRFGNDAQGLAADHKLGA